MSGFYPSLGYIGMKINRATNTKESIITAANCYENILKKIKEEKSIKILNEKEEIRDIRIDPNEVQPIVLKDNYEKER